MYGMNGHGVQIEGQRSMFTFEEPETETYHHILM
jgi:hypothetical protein